MSHLHGSSGVRLDARHDFVNLAIARLIGRGDPIQESAFAEARGWTRPALEIKASVDVVGENDFVSAIGTDYAKETIPLTLPGRLPGIGKTLFDSRLVGATGDPLVAWVAAGAPLPITQDAFVEDPFLRQTKLGSIFVVSPELTRSSLPSARAILEARLERGIQRMVDAAFTDPTFGPVTDTSPGSVAFGAPSFDAPGGAVADIDAAAAAMVDILVDGGSDLASAAWIMSPKVAIAWGLKRGSSGAPAYPGLSARGGIFCGLPVFTSAAVGVQGSPSEDIVLLVDAAGVVIADDGELAVSSSGQASVQMSSTPAAGATSLISLWQKNLNGLRILRTINWARRRPASVVVLRHVTR